MKFYFSFSIILFIFILNVNSCKDTAEENVKPPDRTEFHWEAELSSERIPDFQVKGILNGNEVKFGSVVLEVWRGSGDNVLNFSVDKPSQPCGYIQNYQGFQLVKKNSSFTKGEYIKKKFDDISNEYDIFYKYITPGDETLKSTSGWNCALVIENISDKIANGKIAICFNDEKKSWIAGKFEAIICIN